MVPDTEIVTVAEGIVVVPPLVIVTSVVLRSVTVLEGSDQYCPKRLKCCEVKTNVREVGRVTVLVISSIPS